MKGMHAHTRPNTRAVSTTLTNSSFVIRNTLFATINEYMCIDTASEKYMESEMKYCTMNACV